MRDGGGDENDCDWTLRSYRVLGTRRIDGRVSASEQSPTKGQVASAARTLLVPHMNLDWQTESGTRRSAFVSATSSDLGECRRRASQILLESGIFPVVQDYFSHTPRTVEEMVTGKILATDAVVCLVGSAFGASPTVDGNPAGRSYTQMEYDLAMRYQKPVYLFVASNAYTRTHPVDEPELLRANQAAYREAILRGSQVYREFSSEDELERHIRALVTPILAHVRRSIKYVHVPPAAACFVGRTDEVGQLNQALDRRTPSVITILGMAGQGKTTLLAQALRQRQTLPFGAGVWVSAERSDFTFSEFLDSALSAFLEHRFHKEEMPRLDTRCRKLIDLLQTRPLLIVIDAVERWLTGWVESREVGGFDDLSLRQGAYEGLDEFLTEVSALENGSHVVLTSRALPAALDTVSCAILPVFPAGAPEIGLQSLFPDAAIELLHRLGMVAPREKLRRLAESLVGHPLTLTGFARVAKRLGNKWEPLLASKGTDPSSVFHSMVNEIRKHLPDRRRSEAILEYASLLPEGASLGILGWLLRSEPANALHSADNTDLLPLILTLADWNLLTWNAADDEVRLHGLMAAYFLELVGPKEKDSIHLRATIWYETQTRAAGDEMRCGILAVRHAVSAKDAERAYRAMFQASAETGSLYEQMMLHGHLWECTELLESLEAASTGTQKVQCTLARAQILNELELSHRALEDLHAATHQLLAEKETERGLSGVLLARCEGLEGAIHLETGRATNALPLLDRAITRLEALAEDSGVNQMDLVKTLANRGLAKWGCGDWDGAEADYRQALDRLPAPDTKGAVENAVLSYDLQARLAALYIDRGDPARAIPTLKTVVNEFDILSASLPGRPSRTDLATRMFLVAAYIGNEQNGEAAALARQMALPLEEFSRHGRWEFHGVLAQLRMNEATALLRLGMAAEALEPTEKALCLYEDMEERGATQFHGQLTTALFRRAEARVRCGNESGGGADVRRALVASEAWLLDWYGECNVQSVFIDNALRTLSFLPEGFAEEKRETMRILRECARRIAQEAQPLAATVREKEILQENWEKLKTVATEIGVPWDSEFP